MKAVYIKKCMNRFGSNLKKLTYHLIADVVTIIGTQDIVFGEIDR